MSFPAFMNAWRLHGAGMARFGVHDAPERVPLPPCDPHSVLMKVEAIGLCFSDVKLINAGERHPRVRTDDLSRHPLIPGHEAVLRVEKVGAAYAEIFHPGERYIIQADCKVNGERYSYGYAIDGGMAQYSCMTSAVLQGDEGCYLVPVPAHLSAAEAAVIEPWTCVVAAYRIPVRTTFKTDGVLRIVGDGTLSSATYGSLLDGAAVPQRIICENVNGRLREEIARFADAHNRVVEDGVEMPLTADDLILLGHPSSSCVSAPSEHLNPGGICCYVGAHYTGEISVDIGAVHYAGHRYIGTTTQDISCAYTRATRTTPLPGGVMWFLGGAGAMGHMHVQWALSSATPPRKILVTDINSARLRHLTSRMHDFADKAGVEIATLNPTDCTTPEAYDAWMAEHTEGKGCDDVCVLAPDASCVSLAQRYMSAKGVMNIFAGVPVGTCVPVSLNGIVQKEQRIISASGSTVRDMRDTCAYCEDGRLHPAYSVAAVGGMASLKDAIKALMAGVYPGKIIIYPHADALPLVACDQLESVCTGIGALLSSDGSITRAAEDALRAEWEKTT